jgi:hypothetical protein
MTRPLRIQSETSPKSLKEMSNTEIEYAAHRLLTAFANTSTGTGTLSVNPGGTGGLTLIGSFVDTYRPDPVGAHPVGTSVISITYDFYQNLSTDNTNVIKRPVEYTSGQGITTQSNTDIEEYIVSIAANRLVADGLGSYKLQTTSPSVGGTWVSTATISDIAQSGNNYTYLWRRTTQTAPTTYRPLKEDLIGNEHSLKEMSDDEIDAMVPMLRNYIVSSGIGQYKVQQSIPSGGTWVTSGSAFSDTRQQLGNVSYSGNYAGTYIPTFTGTYTSPSYTSNFSGATYTGSYTGSFTTVYTGAYSRAFTGFYRLFYGGYGGPIYSGNYTGFFSGNYTSPSYTSNFSGSPYTGSYTGSFTSNYVGNYTPTGYTGNYSGLSYSGNYTGYYSASYSTNYTGAYSNIFTGNYQAFYGGYGSPVYSGNYTGFFSGNYTGSYTGTYVGTYSGSYSGSYSGTYAPSGYIGNYSGNYTGQTVLITKDTISTISLWMRIA